MSSDVSDSRRRQVAERAYHVCEYCLIHEDDTFWGCQIDHIVSRKHGGDSDLRNLAWACAVCNSNKGSDIATLVGEPPRLSRLFHPRTDRWLDQLHLNEAIIEPVGEPGAATIKLLLMNDPERIAERAASAHAGRYPTIEALARMKE
jgi:hypothetical protein